MGIFTKLTKAVVKTVATPVAAVADVVTLGGLNTDQDEPYTVQTLKSAVKDLKGAKDDFDRWD